MTNPTQEDDVKALKDALALGPTLGKWSVDGHFGEWGISSDHSVGGACKSGRQFVAACFRVSKKDTPKYAAMFEATARYIAEANPERIARLLDHIEAQAVRLEAAVLAEREACAKLCDRERAEFMPQAGANDGRQSDMAFGSVNSAERLADAIRHRAAIASEAKP